MTRISKDLSRIPLFLSRDPGERNASLTEALLPFFEATAMMKRPAPMNAVLVRLRSKSSIKHMNSLRHSQRFGSISDSRIRRPLALLLAAWSLAACAGQADMPGTQSDSGTVSSEVSATNVEDAAQLARQGRALLLDIRESVDSSGLAFGAVHVPRSRIATAKERINPNARIIVYGQRDDDATLATRELLANGFQNVAILQGGIGAWVADGLPVGGVKVRAKPSQSPAFARARAESASFGPAMVLVYKAGINSQVATDAIAGVAGSSGFVIPTVTIKIQDDGSKRLETRGPPPSEALHEFTRRIASEVLTANFAPGRIVAVGFAADGDSYPALDATATRIKAIQTLVQQDRSERSPQAAVERTLTRLLQGHDSQTSVAKRNIAFFQTLCDPCRGTSSLVSAVTTTARLARARWLVFLPASIRGISVFGDLPEKESISIVRYDDLAAEEALLIAQLHVLGVKLPMFLPADAP